jgi:WD40 repeat protein
MNVLTKATCSLYWLASITSRNTPMIGKGFSQLQNVTREIASPENTFSDIKLYVEKRVEELDIDRIEYRQKVTLSIVEKSEGCFLWVVLVLEELENAFSESEIDRILMEVPMGMDSLYKRTLEGMSQVPRGKSLAKAILMWSTSATRVLTLKELEVALRIQTKDDGIFALEKLISSTCGNLVYVDRHKKVRMIHHTAREYLMRDEILDSEFAIRSCDTHGELADTCLQYLNCDEMKAPRSRKLITSTEQRTRNRSLFADYACKSFSDHLTKADATNDTHMVLLEKFFRSNVLSWIEAVVAKGTLSLLILTAKNLRNFLESRKMNGGSVGGSFQLVTDWATDLVRIVAKFGRNLLESPTAIYWLIPAFCPSESPLKIQSMSFKGGLSVTGLSNAVWNDRLACNNNGSDRTRSVARNDKHFAVGLSSGKIHLYFQDTCQEFRILKPSGQQDPARLMVFNTSGNLLLCAGVRIIRLWNLTNGTEVWSSTSSIPPVAVMFSQADTTVISISNRHSTTTHESSTGKIISSIIRHISTDAQQLGLRRLIDHATFSFDHNLVAVVYRGQPMAIYNMDDNDFFGSCACARVQETRDGRGDIAPLSIIFNPNSQLDLIAALYLDGDLALYDTVDLELIKLVHGADAKCLAASPAGRTLATGDAGGIIQIYDFETLKLLYRIVTADQTILSMLFSTDGMRILDIRGTHSNIWEPSVLVKEDATESESAIDTCTVDPKTADSRELHEKGGITVVAVHPTKNIIFAGIEDGSVIIYDSTTGTRIRTLCRHKVGVSILHIIFGHKSNILLTADTAARVLIWKISKDGDGLQSEDPWLDHRFPYNISQLLLNSTEDRILVSMGELCMLWNLTDTERPNASTRRVFNPRIWLNDEENSNEAIAIGQYSPYKMSVHSWVDLSDVFSTEMSDISSNDCFLNVWSAMKGQFFAEAATLVTKQSRRLVILNLSPEFTESAKLTPTKWLLPSEFRCIIGIYLDKLLFLDESAWICSIDLSETPQLVGVRTPPDEGDEKPITRHFFIPDDWLSTNSEIIFRVLANSNFLFVKGHEIAIISRALL